MNTLMSQFFGLRQFMERDPLIQRKPPYLINDVRIRAQKNSLLRIYRLCDDHGTQRMVALIHPRAILIDRNKRPIFSIGDDEHVNIIIDPCRDAPVDWYLRGIQLTREAGELEKLHFHERDQL